MQYEFKKKKITVMGLGLFGGGVGVAQFLAKQGAHVTITDLRNATELAPSIKQLEDFLLHTNSVDTATKILSMRT